MSQAKVDRYKEEKRNRAQNMKKAKRQAMITKLCGVVIAAAFVFWIGYSVVSGLTKKEVEETASNVVTEMTGTYHVDTAPLDDFLGSLSEE